MIFFVTRPHLLSPPLAALQVIGVAQKLDSLMPRSPFKTVLAGLADKIDQAEASGAGMTGAESPSGAAKPT